MEEIWKDIPGYEGKYQVSNLGRVKSLPRIQEWHHKNGTVFSRSIPGRILRPGPINSGHLSVVLGHGKPGVLVHQLVMLAFVGEKPSGTEICHNDGNPANNHLENLRYDTRRENILDEYRSGRAKRTKLEVDQVREIRERLLSEEKVPTIASDYGVPNHIVYGIKEGRTYKWAV